MASQILVTGGTGTLGRLVVPLLRAAGNEVRVLSRSSLAPADGIEYVTGDLLKDGGIDAAVSGVAVVVHLAGDAKTDEQTTRKLMRAASNASVGHLVYISVIAADRVPLGYFRAKAAAERIVAESGVPFTTLRAAQFHDFVATAAKMMVKLPVIPFPSVMRVQPVDAADVAERLVQLAVGAPAGRVPDLAGPKVYPMTDLLRDYLRANGKRRPIVPIGLPGKVGRAYRAGDNLALDAELGRRTWEDFLTERFAHSTSSA